MTRIIVSDDGARITVASRGPQGIPGPEGAVPALHAASHATGGADQVDSIGSPNPGATLGADIGNGTTSVALTGLTIGQTYHVQAASGTMTGCTLDGVALGVANNATSFRATATSHTVTLTGGTAPAITVQMITGAATDTPTVGGLVARALSNNAAIGTSAQRFLTTGTNNVAIGASAQQSLTTGVNNAAIGTSAQRSLTTGVNNAAIGTIAQQSLTTGSGNAAIGTSAQQSLTTGVNNAAIGSNAQRFLTTGTNNAAIGANAQFSLTTGSGNTAIGASAQQSLTTGVNNAAIGTSAQLSLTTGSGNAAIGFNAGRAFLTGNNNTSIGNGAGHLGQSDVSGSVQIGTDSAGNGAFTAGSNQIALGTVNHAMKCGAVDGDTGFWAFGVRKAGAVSLDTSQYLTVKVDGVTYKVGIVT